MLSSAECRQRAEAAQATAATTAAGNFRTHYEEMADDWARLAVTALAQEVMESTILGRANFSA